MRALLPLALLALTAGCTAPSSHRSLGVLTVAVAGDHVLLGRSVTYGRDGSFELSSMMDESLRCSGRFRYLNPVDGRARFRCSNGETGTIRIRAEGAFIGSGTGDSSLGPVELLFGYAMRRVNARLPLPSGTRLAVVDGIVVLVEEGAAIDSGAVVEERHDVDAP